MTKKPLHSGILDQSNLPWLAVLLPLALVVYLLFRFAGLAYPPPINDATNFIPPVISLTQGNGFINHLWPILSEGIDSSGSGKFVGHGFLYQLYLSTIGGTDLINFYLGHAAIAAITLLCSVVLFLRLSVTPLTELPWRSISLLSVMSLSMATHLIIFGRPDVFAELFVVLGVLACITLPYPWVRFLLPILIGILAVSSITAPAFALPLLGLFLSYKFSPLRCIKEMTILFLVPALVALLLTSLFFTYSLAEWVSGIFQHIELAVSAILETKQHTGRILDLTAIRYYWIIDPGKTAYGVAVVIALQLVAVQCYQNRAKIRSPLLFLLFFIGLLLLIVLLTVLKARTSYRFLPFMPLAFVVLLQTAQRAKSAMSLDFALPALLLGLTTIGFVRSVALFPYFLNQGQSYLDAKQEFTRLKPLLGDEIGVTGSLWTLGDDLSVFRKSYVVDRSKAANISSTTPLLVQQQYLGSSQAPQLKKYNLHHNGFVSTPPTLFGIRLATSVPGYQFAAYLPKKVRNEPK